MLNDTTNIYLIKNTNGLKIEIYQKFVKFFKPNKTDQTLGF